MRTLARSSIVVALMVCAPFAGAGAQQAVEPSEPVVIRQSESFTLHSHVNGSSYRVSVGLPSSYGQEPGKRYPVLYAVDADAAFASMVEITRLLAFAGELPEVIVVGIGYGTDLASWSRRRVVDLNPRPPAEPAGSAGVSEFIEFITGDVIPLVEGRYPCTGDRAFFGYSLAGLFGTWVLFQRPGIFQKYILGSPSYGMAGRVALDLPSAVGRTGPTPSGVVFTAVGTDESRTQIANWQAFWEETEGLGLPGLRVVRREIDETHTGASWHTFVKGVKSVWH